MAFRFNPFTGGLDTFNQADFESTSNLVVSTTAVSLFNVSAVPTMYIVFITHIAGNAGGWAVISGDDSSPRIVTQDSNSSTGSSYIFEIDGQSVDVKTNTSSLTSVWKAYRVI
jgi:hypothetical protein